MIHFKTSLWAMLLCFIVISTIVIPIGLTNAQGENTFVYIGFEEGNAGESVPNWNNTHPSPGTISDFIYRSDAGTFEVYRGDLSGSYTGPFFNDYELYTHRLNKSYTDDIAFVAEMTQPSTANDAIIFGLSDESKQNHTNLWLNLWIEPINNTIRISESGANTTIPLNMSNSGREWIEVTVFNMDFDDDTFSISATSDNDSVAIGNLQAQTDIDSYQNLFIGDMGSGDPIHYDHIRIGELTGSLELSTNKCIAFGDTQQVYANHINLNNQKTDVTASTDIFTSNSSLISINPDNTITAHDIPGIATISADYQGLSAEINVTSANSQLQYIHILPSDCWFHAALELGEENTFHGLGSSVQWLWAIVVIGSIFSNRFRSAWIGIGTIIIGTIFIWVLGNISLGVMLSGIVGGLTIGLTLLDTGKITYVGDKL